MGGVGVTLHPFVISRHWMKESGQLNVVAAVPRAKRPVGFTGGEHEEVRNVHRVLIGSCEG
jgi:hypothetical protein